MPIPGNFLSPVTEMVDPNTSGWVAMLNCTISLGINGRNGNGVLAVKSAAAGEIRARTVSSYPVTAGTLYQVFADAAGTVVERIGIRWLNAANGEISFTWSVNTATASSSLHRVGVAGVAPANAVRAQIVLSSTPAAAAVTHFWENVYFGFPMRTTGNLFGFGTESLEIDATGWAVEANCILSRPAPAVQWPVDNYLAGAEVLGLTVTATGNASVLSVDRPVVTPGSEYQAYCYLNPPTTAADTWVELRFYNAAGTQIQATRSNLAAPGTGWYRQVASAFAPPTAVKCGVAIGITAGTAAQVVRAEQIVVAAAPVVVTGSVIPFADASFEQGVAGWTKTSGVATIARSTPWGTWGLHGTQYSLTLTSSTATASSITSARFPLGEGAGGLSWRAQFAEIVTAGAFTYSRGVRWYDAAGTDLGLTGPGSSAVPTPGWWLLSTDQIAPAGATQASFEITFTATSAASVIRLDSVALWQTKPTTEVVVNSETASTTVTLRELVLDDVLTVYRVSSSGTRTLVRGPEGLFDQVLITSDTITFEDYEAPLGVEFTYLVLIPDPITGLTATRTMGPFTIPHDDINRAWLKDPGNPQRNMQVMVGTAPEWQRPIEQSAYVVRGRRNKVILSGRRQGLEGDLTVWTLSDDDREALHWLLDSGNVLMWQAAPGMGVDDMFVNVGQITEARTGGVAMEPMRLWTLPLVEADLPVTTGVNGSAGRTWVDVVAEFTNCSDVLDTYATCEDLLLDRRISG